MWNGGTPPRDCSRMRRYVVVWSRGLYRNWLGQSLLGGVISGGVSALGLVSLLYQFASVLPARVGWGMSWGTLVSAWRILWSLGVQSCAGLCQLISMACCAAWHGYRGLLL